MSTVDERSVAHYICNSTIGQFVFLSLLVFEYFEKGTVIEIPTEDPLSEEEAWKYFRDLTLGIEYRK